MGVELVGVALAALGVLLDARPADAQPRSCPDGASTELARAPAVASVVDCESWDGIVDRDIVFSSPCTFDGQVQLAAPHVTLDCRGGVIRGSRLGDGEGLSKRSCSGGVCAFPGVTVIDRDVLLDTPLAVGTRDEITRADPSVHGVVVQNCVVEGFSGSGILLRRHPRNARGGGWNAWWTVDDGDPGRLELRHRIGAHDVTIRDCVVRNNAHVGIYLWQHAERVRIERTVVENNLRGGIYAGAMSRENVLAESIVRGNGDIGLSLDASPRNRVRGSCFEAGRAQRTGVMLYRNCGEAHRVRWYHSSDNLIERSTFVGLDVAVWIGARQGLTYDPARPPRDCMIRDGESAELSTPPPPDACFEPGWWGASSSPRRFRDYAERVTVRECTFVRNARGVIVWDDDALVEASSFVDQGRYDVCVGNTFRQSIGDPLRGVRIVDNRFGRTRDASARAPHLIDRHAAAFVTGSRYDIDAPAAEWSTCDVDHSAAWTSCVTGALDW